MTQSHSHISARFVVILFTIVTGCKSKTITNIETGPVLFSQPAIVDFQPQQKYRNHPLTGELLQPIQYRSGDTIQTGIAFPFQINGQRIPLQKAPAVRKVIEPAPTLLTNNRHPVPATLKPEWVSTSPERGNKSGIQTKFNSTAMKGTLLEVTKVQMPFQEPAPVTTNPFRKKDKAARDIQYLDVEQGLSYSFAYDVLQDKRGMFWFGMDGTGLSKYDGQLLWTYTKKEGLIDNVIFKIIEDHKGVIWIATQNGFCSFDGQHFTQYKSKKRLFDAVITDIMEDRTGSIWISTAGSGLIRYDQQHFYRYTAQDGLKSDLILTSMQDQKGIIWVSTAMGISMFDGKQFSDFRIVQLPFETAIHALLEDKQGTIWMASINSGLYKFDGRSLMHYTEREGLSSNSLFSLKADRNGNLWIGTSFGGINKFDGKEFTVYNLEEGLSNNKVRGITEDRYGNIWFGTDGGGINKLNEAGFSYPVPNEAIGNNRVRPILKDKTGRVWLGTEGVGISRLEFNPVNRLFYYSTSNGLNGFGQRSFLQDRLGNLWIGTTGFGAIRYNGTTFTNFTTFYDSKSATVFSMEEDAVGNIWMGTENGIHILGDDVFLSLPTKNGLPDKRVLSIYKDRQQNLWIATDGCGLFKYNGKELIVFSEREGLPSNHVSTIIEDHNGDFWIGTLGGGVCRFTGKQFVCYTDKQGLSNNNVWSLQEDAAHRIWVGTDKGLNQFVLQTHAAGTAGKDYTIISYGLNDGLKAMDFNLRSVCIDNSNRIVWGTGNGLAALDLHLVKAVENNEQAQLSSIEINDAYIDFRNLPNPLLHDIRVTSVPAFSNIPNGLTLLYNQNHLRFRFTAPGYPSPHQLYYTFRLVGWADLWSKPAKEHLAEFRNLSHGTYQFQVRTMGKAQLWSAPLTYSFTILPPWWLTWWFKLISALLSAGILFSIVRYVYRNQLQKQKAVLEKKLAVQYERQRIAAEMHDDIGAGLSGIRLLTELTKQKVTGEEAAGEVEKIYQSVGEVAAKMKEVIWSLDTENDHLDSLLSYLQQQVRKALEHYPCELRIELPGQIPSLTVKGESRRNILLLVKEAIHNIIKHSSATKVLFSAACNTELLILIIQDNGIGITDHTKGMLGNGLKNMQLRTEKLNGNIFITNQEGLTLKVEIPLNKLT